ncbi:MAG: Txe/YoeB family addiction module toxin [Selenomonadaceae bacterium]|nr:Txe/YoeB family addiction module toxin [Selenomonadaceae bacterium]
MILAWSEQAWNDYCYWQGQDKKTLKRINKLLEDIRRNGYEGIGSPEPLKYDLSECWSRRIDDTNRVVYKITDDTAFILQCGSHYRDK